MGKEKSSCQAEGIGWGACVKARVKAHILLILRFATIAANLFVFAFVSHSIYESRVSIEKNARTETENLATILDYSLSEKIRRLDFVLQTAAREFERQSMHGSVQPEVLTAYLRASQQSQTELDGLRITDDQGLITYNRNDGGSKISLADRDYFIYLRDHPNADNYVGKAVKSRVTGRLVLPVARRLQDTQGNFAGIVYATIWVDELARQFRGINIGEDGAFYLLDDSFNLIARYFQSDSPDLLEDQADPFQELRDAVASGIQASTYTPDNAASGIVRIHSYRKLPVSGLIVIAAKAEKTYLQPWYHLSVRYLGFCLLFLVISVLAMRSIDQDIRERKKSEEALRQAMEAAEAANQAKSRFLAIMSHELRTPLNGVLGMAQMLMFPNIEESERIEYATTITESGQRLLGLLNDILDHAKIEAEKLALTYEEFVPNDLLVEMRGLFGEAARQKDLVLSVEGEGVSSSYWADSNRLRQILSNLVNNALKFTDQGFVTLSVRSLRTHEGHVLRFAVRDSGIGISTEKQSALFEPFSQVDDSSTRRFSGTGLGLSICMKLIQLMNGKIGLASQPGQGATFWFEIPAHAKNPTESLMGDQS
ncbi:MAG: hypothetical protein RIR18_2327 [Pseudomonadota bacterium]|jgi:signal transduction histidine kinase